MPVLSHGRSNVGCRIHEQILKYDNRRGQNVGRSRKRWIEAGTGYKSTRDVKERMNVNRNYASGAVIFCIPLLLAFHLLYARTLFSNVATYMASYSGTECVLYVRQLIN
jgi:hypothetical protein